MKFRRCVVLSVFLLSFVMLISDTKSDVSAHPGRTDSNGCHTCRTNCAKWGLSQGEYHCHGGGSSSGGGSGSSNSESYNNAYNAQQEQIARQQAEEQRQAQIKADIARGKEEGYAYKIANPDSSVTDISGQNENYMNGYKEGFDNADKELTSKTKEIAEENAKADASMLMTMNEEIPEGVKSELYMSEYKKLFTKYEQEYFADIKLDAQHSAKIDVYDKYGRGEYSSEIEEKGRIVYKETYDYYINYYEEIYENEKIDVNKAGYEDGSRFNKKSNVSYYTYKEYKIYADFEEIYNEAYKQGKEHTLMLITGGSLIAVIIILIIFIRKKKLKNTHKALKAS